MKLIKSDMSFLIEKNNESGCLNRYPNGKPCHSHFLLKWLQVRVDRKESNAIKKFNQLNAWDNSGVLAQYKNKARIDYEKNGSIERWYVIWR